MDIIDKTYDRACCEIDDILNKQKFDKQDVEMLYSFIDIVKDIYEMDSIQDSMGYSQTGGSYTNGNSYAMRGRSNRMNPMYNRSYGRSSYGHSMNGEYSRDESKVMMLDQLERAMDMAVDERDRKAVERLMDQMSKQN